MLLRTALQRRPLIGMHADRSAGSGPVSSAQCRQASMSTAAAERRGEGWHRRGRSASSRVPSKVQTRIHTHIAGTAKDWERRAGGEQQCTPSVPKYRSFFFPDKQL